MSSATAEVVLIQLKHHQDEDAEYSEITIVEVDILVNGTKAGSMHATVIDRHKIPNRCFYSAFDAHSSTLQWVGSALMEPRYGRTRLQSLAEHDDPEFDFMLIDQLHLDDVEHKNNNSDIATEALRQLLHHPFVRGQPQIAGQWMVSSAAFELDAGEEMSSDELQRWRDHEKKYQDSELVEMFGVSCGASGGSNPGAAASKSGNMAAMRRLEEEHNHWLSRFEELERKNAVPFLRNGFFQDEALAKQGDEGHKLVVASHGHFCKPIRSEAEVSKIRFRPRNNPIPTGKDGDLFKYIKSKCSGLGGGKHAVKRDLKKIRRDVLALIKESTLR